MYFKENMDIMARKGTKSMKITKKLKFKHRQVNLERHRRGHTLTFVPAYCALKKEDQLGGERSNWRSVK